MRIEKAYEIECCHTERALRMPYEPSSYSNVFGNFLLL